MKWNATFLKAGLSLGMIFFIEPKLYAQELLPIDESYRLQEQINKFRIFGRNLKYDTSQQAAVDKYALSKLLTIHYRHSGGNYENICKGFNHEVFIVQWKMSPGHRKNMRRWRHKRMCARFSKVGDEYFGVVRFYK